MSEHDEVPRVVEGERVDPLAEVRPAGGTLARREHDEVVPVLDAELLPSEPQGPRRPAPQHIVGRVIRRPVHIVTSLRHSEKAKSAAVRAVLAVWLTGQGFASWARRAAFAMSHGVLREQVRAHRQAGQYDELVKVLEMLRAAKNDRHRRLRELPQAVFGVVRAAVISLVVLGVLLVALALGVQFTPGGWGWSDYWNTVWGVVLFLGTALYLAALFIAYAGGPILLMAAFREGKRASRTPPQWLRVATDEDVVIDESTIAQALDALRIPQIRDYLKEGGKIQFIQFPRTDGRGTLAVFRIPGGVPAEQVAKRRDSLAATFHRLPMEVWLKTDADAGLANLWVADKGALAEGAGKYPLLTEGMVDIFKGVPFGKTLRGDPLLAPMMERNTICGGMPGQGKSSAARAIMAGAALDITCELRIWVPDTNFDFEAFKPRCSRYVMGAEDEKIAQILADLQELHAEVQRRGQLLVKYEIPAVTREYASKKVGLHPIVALLEEAHVAIQHAKYGGEISQFLIDIVKLGRKRGIHIIVSTQAPTKDSMPRDVTRNCSNGIAFAVGDHVANDALLGQGAYRAGHRATDLIPGTDKGTAIVKGFSGERSEAVQAYFLNIDKEAGPNEVTPLIDRALDAIARAGRDVPGMGVRPALAQRDLLADLDAVLGTEPVKCSDVVGMLAGYAPSWAPYQKLTGKALREALLRDHEIRVPSTGNRWPLDPAAVREALARRPTPVDLDALDDDDGVSSEEGELGF